VYSRTEGSLSKLWYLANPERERKGYAARDMSPFCWVELQDPKAEVGGRQCFSILVF
jgi:hypothetical protein